MDGQTKCPDCGGAGFRYHAVPDSHSIDDDHIAVYCPTCSGKGLIPHAGESGPAACELATAREQREPIDLERYGNRC